MNKIIKTQILEWDSYLPQVKKQSIDVLVENIIYFVIADYQKNQEQQHIASAVELTRKNIAGMIDKIDFGLVTRGKAEVIDTLKYKLKNKLYLLNTK